MRTTSPRRCSSMGYGRTIAAPAQFSDTRRPSYGCVGEWSAACIRRPWKSRSCACAGRGETVRRWGSCNGGCARAPRDFSRLGRGPNDLVIVATLTTEQQTYPRHLPSLRPRASNAPARQRPRDRRRRGGLAKPAPDSDVRAIVVVPAARLAVVVVGARAPAVGATVSRILVHLRLVPVSRRMTGTSWPTA